MTTHCSPTNSNNYLRVSSISDFLICPLRLWLKVKTKVPAPSTLEMVKGRFLHQIKHEINEATNQATAESLSQIIDSFSESVKPYLEIFNFDEDFLNNYIMEEVWKDWGMKQKGIKIITELPLKSETLKVSGRADRVEFFNGFVWVWELKTTNGSAKIKEYHKLQLATYALMIEEEYDLPVRKGFVEFVNDQNKTIAPVLLDDKIKSKAKEVIVHIHLLLSNSQPPSQYANTVWGCKSCPNEITKMCPLWKKITEEHNTLCLKR